MDSSNHAMSWREKKTNTPIQHLPQKHLWQSRPEWPCYCSSFGHLLQPSSDHLSWRKSMAGPSGYPVEILEVYMLFLFSFWICFFKMIMWNIVSEKYLAIVPHINSSIQIIDVFLKNICIHITVHVFIPSYVEIFFCNQMTRGTSHQFGITAALWLTCVGQQPEWEAYHIKAVWMHSRMHFGYQIKF